MTLSYIQIDYDIVDKVYVPNENADIVRRIYVDYLV